MRHSRLKKIRSFLFYVVIALGFPVIVSMALTEQDSRQFAQQTTPIYLIPSAQKASKGEQLIVAMQVKANPTSIKGVQVNLTYPSDKLSPPEISYNNSAFNVQIEEYVSNGLITITRDASIPAVDEKTIASLKFTATDDVTPQEIKLAPNSFAISGVDTKKQLPVSLTTVDSSFYQARANHGFLGPFLEFMNRFLPL